MKSTSIPGDNYPTLARTPSFAALHLQERGHWPIFIFGLVKHILSATYLILWILIYIMATPVQQRALKAYAPIPTAIVYSVFVLMHLYGIVSLWKSKRSAGKVGNSAPRRFRHRTILQGTGFLIGLNGLELLAQTYQAYGMSKAFVDANYVWIYCIFLALRCFIAPWFLFARNQFVRVTMFNFINSLFSFIISYGFAIFGVVYPLFRGVLKDFRVTNDKTWAVRNILIGRELAITTLPDFFAKFAMFLGSYVSLRRLVYTMRHKHRTIGVASSSMIVPSGGYQWFNFRRQKRLKIYLVCSILWGTMLITVMTYFEFYRQPCPKYCKAQTKPFFDARCICRHVEIDCVHVKDQNVDDMLAYIEQYVTLLHIRRCDFAFGLKYDSLLRFNELFSLSVEYTNLTKWNGSLPQTLMTIEIRHSTLEDVPAILQSNTPTSLQMVWLEECSIPSLPDTVASAWSSVNVVLLISLGLQEMPTQLLEMKNLSSITLRGNYLSEIPDDWQDIAVNNPYLRSLDMSLNILTSVPVKLAAHGWKLTMSWNPIAILPPSTSLAAFTSRAIVLDDTTYCNQTDVSWCLQKCGLGCAYGMIGNYYCDLACYNQACNYDGGDCDVLILPVD